ncbi:MAG: biotin--[acetyl-CoA-carboxylase] ligase [Parvularculaceae bacterium]|nr:biotin--[acetyl-CoA-carboxylase] ligase [Parvularculaceae bacterium]
MTGKLKSGSSIEIFETLDSTSLEAKRRALSGARGPVWIIALKQTAGYGRRGSAWTQAEGDLAATLLFEPDAPAERIAELSFVSALGVYDAVRRCAPDAPVAVKWPNDILLGGAKIAGLLLELIAAGRAPVVALGVGINIVSAPQGLAYPSARLIDHSRIRVPDPRGLVSIVDECLFAWLDIWRRGGFAAIRNEWLGKAASLGETITVSLPGETIEGVFADLDLSGALILDCAGVRRKIAAGAILPPLRETSRRE